MRIYTYFPDTLPQELRPILYRLNSGSLGMMRDEFVRKAADHVYYVLKDGNFVVGWGLTFDDEGIYRGKRVVYYYIRKSYRYRGHGLRLARFIKAKEGVLQAWTHKFRL